MHHTNRVRRFIIGRARWLIERDAASHSGLSPLAFVRGRYERVGLVTDSNCSTVSAETRERRNLRSSKPGAKRINRVNNSVFSPLPDRALITCEGCRLVNSREGFSWPHSPRNHPFGRAFVAALDGMDL
jgi:hypothetical protein